MKVFRSAMMAGAAMISCAAMSDSANAQIYSGGSTLASKVYRQLFDCWGLPANTSIIAVSSACSNSAGNAGGFNVQILYAPVGSGFGKLAFANHDGSTSTATGLGTPLDSNTIPYTSTLLSGYGYPNFHFAGSDDVITQSDLNTYNSKSAPTTGSPIQIPAFSTPVNIVFSGLDGAGYPLNITTATPTGGTSGLNLSRQALCGIFSGHITKWNNPILTALNGGNVLGTGNISVVHRSDGSGTTFLTTQALIAQCAGVTGPNNETDSSTALYEFRFSNRDTATSQCNAAIPVQAANTINWPDLTKDQCSQPIANPGGGIFISGAGSSGVVNQVAATRGAIGYVSPNFVAPVQRGVLKSANLQSQYDIDNLTGAFQPPTAAGALQAMTASNPVFDPTSVLNPINWSRQGLVPNPLLPNSYPIAGFTWLNLYQCYKAADQTAPLIFNYLTFHYGEPSVAFILSENGFAPIPQTWLNFVAYALTIGPNLTSSGNGPCAGKSGA